MKKEQLADYVAHGREIEFEYKGKMYSITYSPAGIEHFISFCEFNKEITNVNTVEELIEVKRDGITVMHMLESISEQYIWIY